MIRRWRTPPAEPEPPYRLDAKDIQAAGIIVCPYCGGYHVGLCRRVTEIEYHPGGGVKRAVLRTDWDTSGTTWPWDVS